MRLPYVPLYMTRPNYMISCMDCDSQSWKLNKHKNNIIRFICNRCDCPASFSLTDSEHGMDCICSKDTWDIVEKRFDHVMLRCTACEEIAEVWLQDE